MNANPYPQINPELQSAKNLAVVIYALQAATFAVGLTFFVAPLVILAKRREVAGTWIESHLRWQLNTFWFGLVGVAIGVVAMPSLVGLMVLSASLIWIVFRIVQGWSRLIRNQEMSRMI